MEAFLRKQITSDYKHPDGDFQGQHYLTHVTGQDDVRNNNHITVNPLDEHRLNIAPFSVVLDECDLLNNNMTLTNGNILSISLTSPTSTTVTTSIQSSHHCLKFCHRASKKSNHPSLIETRVEQNVQTQKSPKKINNNLQKYDENFSNNKKNKKKKEKPKPKPLRGGPSGGAVGGGGRGRGGISEQEQMMKRRPRKTKKEK